MTEESARAPQRHAGVIGLRPEAAQAYLDDHAKVWPGVLETITRSGIRNYSIYRHGDLLFSYFEYVGENYPADMAAMAADPETRRWWAIMEPRQRQVDGTPAGEWWLPIDEVFHTD